MSGVLLQIGAFSDKDVYLCGSAQISYFKSTYKKHTYFAMSELFYNSSSVPTPGSTVKVQIEKAGDLLSHITLKLNVTITGLASNEYSIIDNFAYNFIEYIDLHIGKYKIDKITSDWLYIHNEFNNKNSNNKNLNNVPNNYLSNFSGNDDSYTFDIYLPIPFYFCRYNNIPLPLAALRTYEKIQANIKFRDEKYLVNKSYLANSSLSQTSIISYSNCGLIANNIYLQNDERINIINSKHEILIEQIYSVDNYLCSKSCNTNNTVNYKNKKISVDFSNISKAIFWVVKQEKHLNKDQKNNYTIYKNNEINITQFKHLILNLVAEKLIADDTEYMLVLTDNNKIGLRSTLDMATLAETGNKFNVNYSFGNLVFSQLVNDIQNIFNNIKIITPSTKENTSINDIHISGYYSDREKQILGHLFNKTIDELKDVGTNSTNVFENIELNSETSKDFTKLKLFVNVEHNIYSLSYNSDIDPLDSSQLVFEANERTPNELSNDYFNKVNPIQNNLIIPKTGINMYSFSLYPFKYYPSGHNNFDNITNFSLKVDANTLLDASNITVFSIGYNILRIEKGNFCLLFSY